MLRTFMRAKLHRLTVTRADVDYVGSITLDPSLMRAAGLLPLEQVDVLNCTNGSRLTTYCIPGREGGGEVGVNGAAALLCSKGDVVLVVAYAQIDAVELAAFEAVTVLIGPGNRVRGALRARPALGPAPARGRRKAAPGRPRKGG